MSGLTITGTGITLGSGISIHMPPVLMLNLDAATYTSGPWIDTVSSRSFTLNNGVSYSSDGGGSLVFDAASSQSAVCSSSLPNLSTWAVEVWHYYTGNNSSGSPEIVTETYAGSGGINYTLGAINNDSTGLSAGWFNGGSWIYTNTSYTLTPDNWYQIVGTYDGYNVNLYVNNVLVESTVNPAGNAYSSGLGIRLMERWDNADYWDGKLGIVNIYDGYMDDSDVDASWNANKARFGL